MPKSRYSADLAKPAVFQGNGWLGCGSRAARSVAKCNSCGALCNVFLPGTPNVAARRPAMSRRSERASCTGHAGRAGLGSAAHRARIGVRIGLSAAKAFPIPSGFQGCRWPCCLPPLPSLFPGIVQGRAPHLRSPAGRRPPAAVRPRTGVRGTGPAGGGGVARRDRGETPAALWPGARPDWRGDRGLPQVARRFCPVDRRAHCC